MRDQYQEEILGEPGKQESLPSGTEEHNSNENFTTFTPEKKPENTSSPTRFALASMSPDIQAT
jgi:hypothetical protein